jgi:hypothetical protein
MEIDATPTKPTVEDAVPADPTPTAPEVTGKMDAGALLKPAGGKRLLERK